MSGETQGPEALDGDDLRAAIASTGLDPVSLARVPEPSDEGAVWTLPGQPDWFPVWETLRDLVPVTGRWPLAVANVNPFWNEPPMPGRPDLRPGAVMRRLPAVDVAGLLDDLERDDLTEPLEEWLDFHLDATADLCGQAPGIEQVRAAVGDAPVEMAVERWLLAWERAHCPDAAYEVGGGYLDWHDLQGTVTLLLLPRPEPWAAAAYTGHYGVEWPANDLRPALFRHWCLEYGAEPAANWDTMQQLVVQHPPADLDAAWEVARAQALLWPDTCGLPGVTVREMARDLVGRDRWFLHLRP